MTPSKKRRRKLYRERHPKKNRQSSMHGREVSPPLCPYCGAEAKLIDSALLYNGKSYGSAWECPYCEGVYVGCHKGTTVPFGTLANAELRAARQAIHKLFDPIWKKGLASRRSAYMALAKQLGIKIVDCHIGMFDLETCQRAEVILTGDEPAV